MYGPTKPAHWATIGFVAVALLVLGGLWWATDASLRLERNTLEAQARDARGGELKLALWAMDSQVMPALGREASRPYHEYSAYYIPSSLHFDGDSEPAMAVWQESPLLEAGTLEPWILMHFQYTDTGSLASWSSPQLPSAQKWPSLEIPTGFDSASRKREELLQRLDRSYSANRLEAVFSEAYRTAGDTPGHSVGRDQSGLVGAPGLKKADEYVRRQQQVLSLHESSRPPVLECEPAEKVLNIVDQQSPDARGLLADSEHFPVRVSRMTAVWLNLEDGQAPQLALVRRVEVGDALKEVAYQGFLVNWKKLAEALTPLVSDRFENARLEPVLNPMNAGEAAAIMSALPLRLVTSGHKPLIIPPSWTSTRTTVAFAWAAAIIALVAVGLGVRSLVALTARRTEFTYAVTHELRTPLTTFQLYTDMLSSGLVPAEKQAGYLQTLNEESRRLSDLVAEVLEFSRIESNAVRTNPGAHTVGELLDSVRDRYAARCAAAGVELALDPNGSADRMFQTDLHIALQIVGTLIDNACKYASAPASQRAADPPRVHVSAQPGPHKLVIEIADNGPGIAPQDRHDLFKPFRRGSHAQGSKVGGVGLGLALAKRWSRLIKGQLELTDHPQGGACFRLTLPAEP